MEYEKAIKVALECMEVVRKKKHSDNLAGFSPNATIKENEILEAAACLTKRAADCASHAPNCALVLSLVADCNCGFAKSHSG